MRPGIMTSKVRRRERRADRTGHRERLGRRVISHLPAFTHTLDSPLPS